MRVDAETTKEVESKLRALLHDTELVYNRVLLLSNFGPRLGDGRMAVVPFLFGAIQGLKRLLECMAAPEPIPAPEQEPDEDAEFEDFGDLDSELDDDDEDYDGDGNDDDEDDPCECCESTTCPTSPAYEKPKVTSLWGAW